MLKQRGLCNYIMKISLFLIFLIPSFVIATTYYVDAHHTAANDNNPGTLDLPWRTIQHAAETLAAGDTVYIRNGVYHEHLYIDNHGNVDNGYIVFSAYPGEKPVIDGTGVSDANIGISLDKSYIKLIGLEIQNWNDTGIWIENASFLEISDCEVHDVFYGIGIADGTHDFEFNRVTVHHFTGYGFDVSPSGGADCYNGTFNECVAHTGRDPEQNVDGFALGHGNQHSFIFNRCTTYNVFDGFDISSRNTKLIRCLSYNCWNGCYKLWQDEVLMVNCIGYNSSASVVEIDWDEEPGASTLMNCTFFNSELYTVWVENSADTLKMFNCILAGGDNIGLAFEQRDASNYRGDHNLFHNDNADRAVAVGYEDEFSLTQMVSGAWTTYSSQDAHSRVSNSATDVFVDPINFNLHILETSNAVDNGTNIGAPSDDYDGNPRPISGGYDVGAYEFQSSVGLFGDKSTIPKSFVLFQNYPNPFNPVTTIPYSIPTTSDVRIDLFNIVGQKIAALLNSHQSPGYYELTFDASNLASGNYFYQLQTNGFSDVKKFVVTK
jgi:hypothetical protein